LSIVFDVLKEEYERNLNMQKAYKKEINSLPKGKIIRKKIGNGTYLYLLYRDKEKVITKYIGVKDKTNIKNLQYKIDKRKYLQKNLKSLIEEEKEIRKVLKLK
jgi:DNA-directed RNA polymerase beta' subunit